MNTIVKKETEGTVLNMLVDASYVPCFEKLRKTGFEIPDLRFMFVYLPDGKVKDLAEFYVGFENYAPIHFIGGVCDPHEEEDFIEIIKCAALRNVLEYDYLQKELLSDLDESELIFEELKWDEEDFEEELCCEKILETNETIDTESCNTLYATLPTAEFPVFALLQSAGFELSNLLCQVKFASPGAGPCWGPRPSRSGTSWAWRRAPTCWRARARSASCPAGPRRRAWPWRGSCFPRWCCWTRRGG